MREDYCDITLVLDESGSMQPQQHDTIGGVNNFLEQQRALPGRCVISLVKFNHEHKPVYLAKAIKDAPKLTPHSYQPNGNTALLDAVGFAIDEAGSRFKAMPEAERPSKVLFVIVTDGEENSSQSRTKDQVAEAIKQQQEIYKWEFVFMGADIDAFAEAGGIGVQANKTMQWNKHSPVATAAAYRGLSANTMSYRSGAGGQSMNWTDEQRKEQEQEQTK